MSLVVYNIIENKMKSLKPSHREKKRYLLISGKDANKEVIEKAILDFIGILGYAKSSPQIVKNSGKKLILAINRAEVDKSRASFLVSGADIRVERVSGTIAGLDL